MGEKEDKARADLIAEMNARLLKTGTPPPSPAAAAVLKRNTTGRFILAHVIEKRIATAVGGEGYVLDEPVARQVRDVIADMEKDCGERVQVETLKVDEHLASIAELRRTLEAERAAQSQREFNHSIAIEELETKVASQERTIESLRRLLAKAQRRG